MDSHPPGLDVDASFVVVSDGGEAEWLHYDKVKLYTNAFIKQNGKVRVNSTYVTRLVAFTSMNLA